MSESGAFQDFRSISITLQPGQELRAITGGCRYLTIYKTTGNSLLEIKEIINNWEGTFTPLPLGFAVGFTSDRGVAFRNAGATAATWVILFGRGPFADNRTISDPYSGSPLLKDAPDITLIPWNFPGKVTTTGPGGGFQAGAMYDDSQWTTYIEGCLISVEKFTVKIVTDGGATMTTGTIAVQEIDRLSGLPIRTIKTVPINQAASSTVLYTLADPGAPLTTLNPGNWIAWYGASGGIGAGNIYYSLTEWVARKVL